MCGIFGVWNFKGINSRQLHKASELLRHRGPDDEGFLVKTDDGVKHFGGSDTSTSGLPKLQANIDCCNALLHRRLSILDLSDAGHQPMSSPDQKLHIVFNGEIYNFRDLISEYGLKPQSGTDTEMILLLYAKIGTDAFGKFRGMWALAILDIEKNELLLSRDRFGIKPLYFTWKNNGLAFSSEIKPLLSLPGISAKWKRDKLIQFLVYGATSDPHETFFEGIETLTPGAFRSYNCTDLSFRESRYYNLRDNIQNSEFAGGNFKSHFDQSISEHLISDVEVGSCLSGGLDSSLIVADAASQSARAFQTVTCAFPGQEIDESEYARELAKSQPNLNQHFTTPTAQGFLDDFDELISTQERPFGSASVYAQYAVMEKAAESGIKVMMDGQGADEILGGYYPFAGAYLVSLLKAGKIKKYQNEIKALKENFNPKMEFAMMRSVFYALPRKLQIMARKRQRLGFELLGQKYRERANDLKSPQRGSTDFTDLSIKSVEFGLYELLHYEDRNAMHFSIESRVPFLDHRLVEWCISQPVENKIQNGWTKYPIREALSEKKLDKIAWRKDKLGFVAPQQVWRLELAKALKEKLDAMVIPEVFDRIALMQLFQKPLENSSANSEFWRIFALLRWMEIFKVELV